MRRAITVGCTIALGVGLVVGSAGTALSAGSQATDAAALLAQIRDRLQSLGRTRFVMPLPGSRSVVLAIDATTPLFFFFERGSIRGSAIDKFYAAYQSGDLDAAYAAFRSAAVPTVRVTDYGWNGLGVPMTTQDGNQIHDILFRVVDGVFRRAPEITDEDIAKYTSSLEILLRELETR